MFIRKILTTNHTNPFLLKSWKVLSIQITKLKTPRKKRTRNLMSTFSQQRFSYKERKQRKRIRRRQGDAYTRATGLRGKSKSPICTSFAAFGTAIHRIRNPSFKRRSEDFDTNIEAAEAKAIGARAKMRASKGFSVFGAARMPIRRRSKWVSFSYSFSKSLEVYYSLTFGWFLGIQSACFKLRRTTYGPSKQRQRQRA